MKVKEVLSPERIIKASGISDFETALTLCAESFVISGKIKEKDKDDLIIKMKHVKNSKEFIFIDNFCMIPMKTEYVQKTSCAICRITDSIIFGQSILYTFILLSPLEESSEEMRTIVAWFRHLFNDSKRLNEIFS